MRPQAAVALTAAIIAATGLAYALGASQRAGATTPKRPPPRNPLNLTCRVIGTDPAWHRVAYRVTAANPTASPVTITRVTVVFRDSSGTDTASDWDRSWGRIAGPGETVAGDLAAAAAGTGWDGRQLDRECKVAAYRYRVGP